MHLQVNASLSLFGHLEIIFCAIVHYEHAHLLFHYFMKIGLHSTRKVQANGLFKDKSFVLQHYRKLL
jgi:hypothetical protein